MRKWEVRYKETVITVENRFNSERLYINGVLQDETVGVGFESRARLFGQLQTGEAIKVSIGGGLTTHCRIFVDNTLLLSD